MTPPQDSAPARAEIATRSRMAEVWERGRKDFPSEIARDILPDPAEEVAWMCHYASMLPHDEAPGRVGIRERLWKLANAAARILPKDYDVLPNALAEYSRAAEKLSEKDPFDVLIVGGGPAGAAAAVYAARKGIRTGVVAERFGGQVLDTMSIENYISVLETDGPKFAAALEAHTRHYGVDIMNLQKVESISRDEAAGMVTVKTASGASLKSKTVILATGARWRSMGVPGEQEYRNRGVTYCPHCDGPLFKGKRVAVIGGGNSGVEAAIDLAGVVDHVTLFEFMPELRADAVLQRKLESLPNVKILKNVQVTEVKASNDKVSAIVYKDRTNDSIHEVALEGVFVQIGLVPNTDFLKDSGITLVRNGEIQVDVRGQTSMEGVFAAGDCTTSPYKQIIIAAGDGAKAALAAFDHLIRTSAPK